MASIKPFGNFIAIVALVCALGIVSSLAQSCKPATGDPVVCGNEQRCALTKANGQPGGCVEPTACPDKATGTPIVCEDALDNCCCLPSPDQVCNDVTQETIKDQACKIEQLKNTALCSKTEGGGTAVTTGKPTSTSNGEKKCFNGKENTEMTCSGDQVHCKLTRDGKTLTPAGCSDEKACPISIGDVTCHTNMCCCKAKGKPCNGEDNQGVKDAMQRATSIGNSVNGPFMIIPLLMMLGISGIIH